MPPNPDTDQPSQVANIYFDNLEIKSDADANGTFETLEHTGEEKVSGLLCRKPLHKVGWRYCESIPPDAARAAGLGIFAR